MSEHSTGSASVRALGSPDHDNPLGGLTMAASDVPRKPLARVVEDAQTETMVMYPMRWPPKYLARADARAIETRSTRSAVIRDAFIAGIQSLELQDLVRLSSGKTA